MRIFKRAVVTGATGGIGEALCTLLASKGISLLIHGRSCTKLQQLADSLKHLVDVQIQEADLGNSPGRQALIEAIRTFQPDLVINNAGFGLYGEALLHETKEHLDIVEVNCVALLEITLEAARLWKSSGQSGVILNVASAAAFPIFPSFAVYSASKAFVVQLSRSLNAEMKGRGIFVLASCPGVVATHFRERAGGAKAAPAKVAPMNSAFAANAIWSQIQSLKPVQIFDWKTRLSILCTRLLPQSLVAKFLKNEMDRLYKPR